MKKRRITVDESVGACYITLSDDPVTETFEYSADILVDLNEYDVAVGIEVLDMAARFPLSDLQRELHIHSGDESYLADLLPTLAYSLRFSAASAPDSTSPTRARSQADRREGATFTFA